MDTFWHLKWVKFELQCTGEYVDDDDDDDDSDDDDDEEEEKKRRGRGISRVTIYW